MKILIFDLDGTLFYKDQRISKNAIQKIVSLEEQGYIVGLATGRFINELDPFIDVLQLRKYGGFVISCNGGHVYDLQDEVQHDFPYLKKDLVQKGIEVAIQQALIPYVHEDTEYRVFSGKALKSVHTILKNTLFKLDTPLMKAAKHLRLETQVILKKEQYEKLCVAGPVFKLEAYKKKIQTLFPNTVIYPSGKHAIEVMHPSVNKYYACLWLMKHRGYSMKDVLFFGDSGNDDLLLKYAGHSIAMKNALPETKQAAHEVSAYTNQEDGVYKELERLI